MDNETIDLIVNATMPEIERKTILMKTTKETMIKCLNNKTINVEKYIKLIDDYWGFNFSDEELDSITIDNKKYNKNNWWWVMNEIVVNFGDCVNFPIEFYLKMRLEKGYILDFIHEEKTQIPNKLEYLPNTIRVMKKYVNNPKTVNYIRTIENNKDISSKGLVLLWQHYSGMDTSKNDLINNVSFHNTFTNSFESNGVINGVNYYFTSMVSLYKKINNVYNVDDDVIVSYLKANKKIKLELQFKSVEVNIKEFENKLECKKEKQIQKNAELFKVIYESVDDSTELTLEKMVELKLLTICLNKLVEPISLEENIHSYYYFKKCEHLKNMKEYILEKEYVWLKQMIQITSLMNEKLLVEDDITKNIQEIISLSNDTPIVIEDKYSYGIKIDNDNTYVPIDIKNIIVQAVKTATKEEKIKNNHRLLSKQDTIDSLHETIKTQKKSYEEQMDFKTEIFKKQSDEQHERYVKATEVLKIELEIKTKAIETMTKQLETVKNTPEWLSVDLMKNMKNASKIEKDALMLLLKY
jgi:hypothetical protein